MKHEFSLERTVSISIPKVGCLEAACPDEDNTYEDNSASSALPFSSLISQNVTKALHISAVSMSPSEFFSVEAPYPASTKPRTYASPMPWAPNPAEKLEQSFSYQREARLRQTSSDHDTLALALTLLWWNAAIYRASV